MLGIIKHNKEKNDETLMKLSSQAKKLKLDMTSCEDYDQ